jgi:hypothetical protein
VRLTQSSEALQSTLLRRKPLKPRQLDARRQRDLRRFFLFRFLRTLESSHLERIARTLTALRHERLVGLFTVLRPPRRFLAILRQLLVQLLRRRLFLHPTHPPLARSKLPQLVLTSFRASLLDRVGEIAIERSSRRRGRRSGCRCRCG